MTPSKKVPAPRPRVTSPPVAKPVGLDRLRRVCAMGSAFALFGLAGLMLGAVALPVVLFRGRASKVDQDGTLQMQRWISHGFRLFVRYMEWVGIMTLEIRGRERLAEPGVIVVANHPTLIDVVVLVAQLPQADCVVKAEAFRNPFMRAVIRSAGYIPNTGGEDWLAACAERSAQGRRILLFPEGTRSPFRSLGPFQRGAAHLSLATGRPLLPVVIHCEPPGLMRGQKWHDVADRAMAFTLEAGEAMAPPASGSAASGTVAAGPGTAGQNAAPRGGASRALNAMLREYFEKRLRNVVA